MISDWCKYNEELNFEKEEKDFEIIMKAVKAIRNRRNEMNVPPSKKAAVIIDTDNEELFNLNKNIFVRLASASSVTVGKPEDKSKTVSIVTEKATVYMPMNELIDFTAEIERIEKELKKALEDKEFFESKLNNPGFINKAPEKVVNAQKEQLSKVLSKIEMLNSSIKDIKSQM